MHFIIINKKYTIVLRKRMTIRCLSFALMLGALLVSGAGGRVYGQDGQKHLDLLMGLDMNYKDIDYVRQYDILLRVTPGFKWEMGNHWQLAGQALVPVFNQYGDAYGRIRLGMLDLSKQFKLGPIYAKGSVGFFSANRYGIDLKAFLPVTSWLALEGEWGYTGRYLFDGHFYASPIARHTGFIGGDIFLRRWNTQLRGTLARYIYTDWGLEGEIMRHFAHSTLDLYAQWNNKIGTNGGFKVVVMLPPYNRSSRFVRIRPTSHFTLNDRIKYTDYGSRTYLTDPDENIREGWFDNDLLRWGANAKNTVFSTKERRAE